MLSNELKQLIDEADVVSFDVFDTLLSRRHYSPADVFGERFRLRRIVAERLARLRHRRQNDVTLEQIYAFLPGNADDEVAAEKQTLFANDDAREIYDYAQKQNKKIVAISDMYLSADVISTLLEAADYRDVSKIYVSSEVGLTKSHGALFRHVAGDLHADAAKIVHIGDHPISDYARPREHGLRSHHLPSARMRFESNDAVHGDIVRALRRGRKTNRSLLLGLMRDGLAGWSGDYWYALGFAVVGPVVNAFVDWVERQFREGGHDRAFFLARDGYLPLEIIRLRQKDLPATYTYASRRLFLVPALETLDRQTLTALSTSLPGTPAEEFWHRLGIRNERVEALLRKHFEPGERMWLLAGRARVEAFFREAHPLFLPDVVREKQALRAYLEGIGLFAASSPLIVDVGWKASSQRYLETAFPELKGTAGAYFGLRAGAYRNGAMRAFFFDDDRPARMRNIATHCFEITELFFSAPHPSIQKIDADDNPVYEPSTPEEERRIDIVRRIHDGALDFTRRLSGLEQAGYTLQMDRDDVAACIEPIVMNPSPRDLEHLGRLPHALGLGTSRYETLLPAEADTSPIALLRRHLGKPRTRLYWPRGVIRSVYDAKGPLHGLAAQGAIAFSKFVIDTWDRVLRMLGK